MRTLTSAILVAAILLSACSVSSVSDFPPGSISYSALPESSSITVRALNLHDASGSRDSAQTRTCTGSFAEHALPHVTGAAFERVTYFTSNGAGLAVGDLDNDGDEDFVLANLLGPNQIFWNEGNWNFRPQLLLDGSLRGLALVDVDGDGWLDISATSRAGIPLYWHNRGTEEPAMPFTSEQEPLRLQGVRGFAYSLQWGDLDMDGDLDLVTASYDASLEKQIGRRALDATNQNGVFIYENENGRFLPTRLASRAQGLALQLLDLNSDRRLDILVGNDFDVHDAVFLNQRDGSWLAADPFATTTFSTMSFDSGDIDNDGRQELFAADMHPYSEDPEIMSQWLPVMETMPPPSPDDGPQVMANVLQERQGDDWSDQAEAWRVPFSGWSWSAQFGDINQDGLLDLYVVNGMTAMEIFRHLPGDELVEENQAYRNDGGNRFTPAPEWKLNSTAGGRSMSMADFDGDGDLDVLINNLRSPSQLFENRLCSGQSLLVDLRHHGSGNTRALGAELLLHTSTGIYRRSVHAAGGYLSGRSARQHFGLPRGSSIIALEVRWPDRIVSLIDGRSLQPNSLLTVTRRNPRAEQTAPSDGQP
ncbi:MAG: CRTAC1 family protein [Caldilineaceae bacterium]|nr:CRTAC1 family protein [Caldilineaceae bacterium]